jgi:hypothetical protein
MFVIYLTRDESLIEDLVKLGNQILADVDPSNLTDEVEFYNSKEFAGRHQTVPESIDFAASRRERRAEKDHAMEETKPGPERYGQRLFAENDGYSPELPLATKIGYANSCIEILGQVLRNFTGTLPGDKKLAILKTTYLLGLRLLRSMLTLLSDASVEAKRVLANKDNTQPEDREFITEIEKLITVVGQITGVSMCHTISLSVGSPDIEESAYVETLKVVGITHASRLVDLAVKLDHSEEYPFELIKNLQSGFEHNLFAQRVLRDMVFANMRVFDIGWEMRQRVFGVFNARPSSDAAISKSARRLKPN